MKILIQAFLHGLNVFFFTAAASGHAEACGSVAIDGVLNGGICGALLDCHSNWTATHFLQEKSGSAKRKGRSSVPSWDEIMFGGSAKED